MYYNYSIIFYYRNLYSLGIGDWGLGIGDWAQSPIPNPQSPIPKEFMIVIILIKYYTFLKRKK